MDILSKRVYESLNGSLIKECRIPGVENAFENGSFCMNLYSEVLDAYARLSKRFGFIDEDDDIEIIINNLLSISEYLSLKMYYYGSYFAKSSIEENSELKKETVPLRIK